MARRKIIRISVTTLLVLLVLVTGALGGIGWYYSGELLKPAEALPQRYPETSLGVDDKNLVLAESNLTTQRGTFGIVSRILRSSSSFGKSMYR